jgi:hypothetical protein
MLAPRPSPFSLPRPPPPAPPLRSPLASNIYWHRNWSGFRCGDHPSVWLFSPALATAITRQAAAAGAGSNAGGDGDGGPSDFLIAPVQPPKQLLERLLSKLSEVGGDESALTRKERKLLDQHRRATAAAEAEARAAQDTLRHFTLSDLQSSSGGSGGSSGGGGGHCNGNDVVIESFSIHAGKKCLFQQAALQLLHGHRYGLVGPNGYGKTTVLRFLALRRLPVPAHISVLHVEQEVRPVRPSLRLA